ncbi:MAG TPA: hypothetical protein VGG19_20510 [Tepidisphaeraceae bacterium]|jgi:predicted ABC-type ATPase
MLAEINRRFQSGESFAFETTLAGRSYARHIRDWRKAGYHIKLIFLKLPSAEAAIARVKLRVRQAATIFRRTLFAVDSMLDGQIFGEYTLP